MQSYIDLQLTWTLDPTGAHFAEVTAMLNMASILAIFDLLRPLDSQGNEVDLKMEFATGITRSVPVFVAMGCLTFYQPP